MYIQYIYQGDNLQDIEGPFNKLNGRNRGGGGGRVEEPLTSKENVVEGPPN
jgi:hypothetical protein